MLRWILIGIGGFIVIVLAVLGALYYLFTRPPAELSEMREVNITEEASKSFDEKMEHFRKALEGGGEVEIELTEEEVSSKILDVAKEKLEGTPLKPEKIMINFKDGEVEVGGEVKVNWGPNPTVNIWGRGEVEVEEGKIKYKLKELKMGSVPGPVMNLLKKYIPEEGKEGEIKIKDLEALDIEIKEGKIILKGKR